ncbi:MAG: methionine--tRNA ligase [Verrucomicrobiae bacterium]|nr:methionine--tRNA ligase [Verrucomicrobiae bacterium]
MSSFFLTTAIDYVNGKPHLGHAYEKVLTDTIARYQRNLGKEVFFLTGVDEHGQKVQQSAQAKGILPQAFCDEYSGYFQEAWKKLSINYSRFVRTTEENHKKVVRQFLQQLYDAKLIYFQEHEGYYSLRQEQFVTEKEKTSEGNWPEIYGEVVHTKEPNYFFKLSNYQDWLIDYVKTHPDWIVPGFRRNEVLGALEKPLSDLCISRPKNRLAWGIPLPFDEEYVTYVWFDALVNYVSFAESHWPADLHVIGKDILIPAHAVYWPIMLKALDLPLPKQFLVHGWWQISGEKMSKSTGNVVDPLQLIETYGADAFRYYVLREMSVGHDAEFSVEQFAQRYRSDLGNDLGNLVNRSLAMLQRYCGGMVPEAKVDETLLKLSTEILEKYCQRMERYEIHLALEKVWRLIQRANQYVEETAPWKLAKDPAAKEKLNSVLVTLIIMVYRISILIEPVMPSISQRIQGQLGQEKSASLKEVTVLHDWQGKKITQPEVLFPRIE